MYCPEDNTVLEIRFKSVRPIAAVPASIYDFMLDPITTQLLDFCRLVMNI